MSEGMKQCWYCDGIEEDSLNLIEIADRIHVACSNCGSVGPGRMTVQEAIATWNSGPRAGLDSFERLLEENSKLTRRLAAKHTEIEELRDQIVQLLEEQHFLRIKLAMK